MSVRDEILEFIADFTAIKRQKLATENIFIGNGIEGDDGDELIIEFGEKFDVNIDGFLAYFHYVGDEPPGHRRILPIDEHGHVIPFMPVTIDMLVQAVDAQTWPVTYPPHTLRKSLGATLLNLAPLSLVFVGGPLLALIVHFVFN